MLFWYYFVNFNVILEVLSISGTSIRQFRSVAKTQRSWCCVFATTKRQQGFWASCWTYVSGFFTVARWKPFLHAYRTFICLTHSLDIVMGVYSQLPKIPKIRHFEAPKNTITKIQKDIFFHQIFSSNLFLHHQMPRTLKWSAPEALESSK